MYPILRKILLSSALIFSACSSPMPHDAPFDSEAPLEKQAKASLSGSVALKNETDAGGVNVRLENKVRSYSFETANDGAFRLRGIVPGSYTLTISTRYFTPQVQPVLLEMGEDAKLPVVVLAPAKAQVLGNALARVLTGGVISTKGGVTIELVRTASLRGAAGAPAYRTHAADATDATAYTALSAPDGSYSIDGVDSGVYSVSASQDGFSGPTNGGEISVAGDAAVTVPDLVMEPLTGFFTIEGMGAAGKSESFTKVSDVTLKLVGFNARQMKIGSSATGAAAGCVYNAAIDFDATSAYHISAEGKETVCVRYIDQALHETADLMSSILYDKTPPTLPGLLINDGAPATAALGVGLRLSAIDTASGVYGYQVSTANAWTGAPVLPYQNSAFYLLPSGDGPQTVWLRYLDAAGNFAAPVSATILAAVTPPALTAAVLEDDAGSVIIANATTSGARVFVHSAVSSVTPLEIQVTAAGSFAGLAWEPYSALKGIDLPPPPTSAFVSHTLSARVRDQVGRQVDLLTAFTFKLDTRAPVGTVSAPSSTNASTVQLALTTNEAATSVEVSEEPSFVSGTPAAFASTLSYDLLNQADGLHILYVRFLDTAGNKSDTQTVAVLLDRTPPALSGLTINNGAAATSALSIGLSLTAIDAASGVYGYQVSTANAFAGVPVTAFQSNVAYVLPAGEGARTLWARFRDNAGNYSNAVSTSILVATLAPATVGLVTLEDDLGTTIAAGATTRSARVFVRSTVTSVTPLEMQVTASGSFSGVAWEPYSALKAVDVPAPTGSAAVAHTISARVRDQAGHQVDLLTAFGFYLDTHAPVGTVAAPSAISNTTIPLTLTTNETGSTSVQVSEDSSFTAAASVAFQTPLGYPLMNTGDGLHILYVRFLDTAGNKSDTQTVAVTLDRSPPLVASITIEQGTLTNSQSINLHFVAIDAVQMTVSENTCATNWIAYAPDYPWTFVSNTDGPKPMRVRFRDTVGNMTACLTATITYDHTPPTLPTLSFLGSALYATNRNTTLLLTTPGASQMQVSESLGFSGSSWQPVTDTVNWTLSAGEGLKTIYVQVRDDANNVAGPVSKTITLDTLAPEQPLVSVDTGGGYAQAVTVTLHLSATGAPTLYRWSVDGVIDNKTWTTMAPTATALLNAADAAQTVLAQFQDAAGNNSAVASASVFLDRSAPSSPFLRIDDGNLYTKNAQGTVTLTLNAADAGSGLLSVKLAGASAALSTAPTLPFEPTKIFTVLAPGNDGLKAVWATFVDRAGNFSTPVSSVITLDRAAPPVVLSIPGGNLAANNILTVNAAAPADTSLMMLSNDPSLVGAAWQSFQNTFLWIFPAVQGPVNLYAQFKDAAGNVSGVVTLAVMLDSTPPVIGAVSGSVVSDTLTWDHLAPDVTSYTVSLFNGTQLTAVTLTTEKELLVGTVAPGFSVVANYQDGTRSWPSYNPGYFVPATQQALLALNMDASNNALATRVLGTAYPGATATGTECGAQVVLTNSGGMYGGMTSSPKCGLAPELSMGSSSTGGMYNMYGNSTPPPYDGGIVNQSGNPLAGVTVRVSGGILDYYYGSGYDPYVVVPANMAWPGMPNPQIYQNTRVIQGSRFDPATQKGQPVIQSLVPMGSLAYGDDATYTVAETYPFIPYEYPLAPQTVSVTGALAGVPVTQVTLLSQWWGTGLAMNVVPENLNPYSGAMPGIIKLPFFDSGSILGNTIVTATNPSASGCWYCTPSRFVTDFGTGTISYKMGSSYYGSGFYENDSISVFNADGSRSYRVPVYQNGEGTFRWSTEYDQPTFPALFKRLVHTLATPTRVRGTGNPRLTSNVADAYAMQVSSDSLFAGSSWLPYATTLTLPADTSVVWVRYRDVAGNTTATQRVDIASPTLAPRMNLVEIAGANAAAGFTTERDVVATVTGVFPPNTRVRYGTTDDFADNNWQPLVNNQLAITLPNSTGRYYYYFWLADTSNNYSLPLSTSVLYDGTPPQAEFSVMPAGVGQIAIQMAWTVSRSGYQPSLTDATPISSGALALPFGYPVNGFTQSTVNVDEFGQNGTLEFNDQWGMMSIFSVHVFKEPFLITGRYAKLTAQQAVIAWKGFDAFGTPITAAITVRPSGVVSLSYWATGAKLNMFADVNSVPSPYSDWRYALVDGSVDYSPNPKNIKFVLRSNHGTVINISRTEEYVCSIYSSCNPWLTRPISDTGATAFIGTAYSLAGAVGRITTRELVLPAVALEAPANIIATPISDGRFWTTWDHPASSNTQAYSVGTALVGPDTIWSGPPYQNSFSLGGAFTNSYAPPSYFYLPRALQVNTTGSVAAPGSRMLLDDANNLLLGADGSIWDSTFPGAPTPLRVFSGNWPEPLATVARWKNYLWTASGIYNLANPEAPVYVQADPGPSYFHAAYRGRVYEIVNNNLKVFNAETFAAVSTVFDSLTGPLLVQGSTLWAFSTFNVYIYDLSNPDAPAYTSQISGSRWFSSQAGIWQSDWSPMASAGPLSFFSNGLAVTPYLYGSGAGSAQAGEAQGFAAKALAAAGPWLFAAGQSELSLGHAGASLPGAMRQLAVSQSGTLAVGSDRYHNYVCGGSGLSWYSHDWELRGTLPPAMLSCSGNESIESVYPYVYVTYRSGPGRSSRRFVFEGSTLKPADLSFAVTTMMGPGTMTLAHLGAGYVGTPPMSNESSWWPTGDRAVRLSDAYCVPVGTDGDRLYCQNQYGNGGHAPGLYGTTLSANVYSGIVTGPLTLPLVFLFDPSYSQCPNFCLTVRDGDIAGETGVYAVHDLKHPELITPSYYRLISASLATDGNGELFKVSDEGVTPIAKLPGVSGSLAISPDGTLLSAAGSSQVKETRWGPGAPEYRYTYDALAAASASVQAGGYVYFAGGAAGLVRLKAMNMAATLVNHSDAFVRHIGNTWTLYNAAMDPLTTTTRAETELLGTLCANWLDRASTSICSDYGTGVTVGQVFQGDLSAAWLAQPGADSETAFAVHLAVADAQGTVYAASTASNIVRMYNSGGASMTAERSITFAGGFNIADMAVDQGTLYVTNGSNIEARNMRDDTLKWNIATGTTIGKLKAAGGYAFYSDANYIRTLSEISGTELNSCYVGSTQDFALVMQRWSGQTHPVAIVASGAQVRFISLLDCLDIANWIPQSVAITAVDLEHGILKIGYGAGGMMLTTLANFPNESMYTRLVGSEPIDRATILGEFVYTSSASGKAQIFQLH